MHEVEPEDVAWQAEIRYSARIGEFTVSLQEWHRGPGPFDDWRIEQRWVTPRVAPGDLGRAWNECVELLGREVGRQTAEELDD